MLHVRDELVGSELLGRNFSGALPAMEEILADNLQYDLDDAKMVHIAVPSSPVCVYLFGLITAGRKGHCLTERKLTCAKVQCAPYTCNSSLREGCYLIVLMMLLITPVCIWAAASTDLGVPPTQGPLGALAAAVGRLQLYP